MRDLRRSLGAMLLWIGATLPELGGCAPEAPPPATDPLDAVKKDLAAGTAVIVDVRGQDEWDAGHLKDAIFIPITFIRKEADKEGFAEKIAQKIPKGTIVYTHCAKGVRAAHAADVLGKMGYEVRPLKQGFQELVDGGLAPADAPK